MSNSLHPMCVTCQAPLSMGFSRQEYWSGLPFPSPGDLPDPGIEFTSFMSPDIGRRVLYHWCYLGRAYGIRANLRGKRCCVESMANLSGRITPYIPGVDLFLMKEMGPPEVPRNPFGEPLSKMFSQFPPARMFYWSFFLCTYSSLGNMVLFIWGPVLPVTCPCALPTAVQEKAPHCSHLEVLAPNGLSVPMRGIATYF